MERSSEIKKLELRRFIGDAQSNGQRMAEHWSTATPDEHAEAMGELALYAEQMSAQTGYTKDVSRRFPGFPVKPDAVKND